MQVYHGTKVEHLEEIITLGGLLCPNDLAFERMRKLRDGNTSKLWYLDFPEDLELESKIWSGPSGRYRDSEQWRAKYVCIWRGLSAPYSSSYPSGIILGFDIYPSMIMAKYHYVWRRLPLDFLNKVIFLDGTDKKEVMRLIDPFSVPYGLYDPRKNKLLPVTSV